MSHTRSSKYQPQNLPVLKNFNAFDILEPEKVNLENTDVSTAMLIDVRDSSNKLEKSLELSPDLHGSFLDKASDFDLLDLYQNIYVTPQQIKKEPRNGENKNSCPDIDPFKIDFTELFEKAEKGKKLSEWTKNNENENSIKNNSEVTTNNARGLEEILDNAISLKCSKLELKPPPLDIPESDPICEDEIDDFLRPKLVVNQSVFKETTPISSPTMSNIKKDVYAKPLNPNDKGQNLLKRLSKPCEAHNAAINDIPMSVSKMSPPELSLQKPLYHANEIKQVQHSVQGCLLNENKIKKLSKIQPQADVTPIYRNEIKTNLTHLNSAYVNHINCQKQSIPMLHTAKMDPKAFIKRRIVKSDAEKIGFTKGPDIHEKSIVLPQMMKRLAERKQVLEQQQHMQRKLILETGVNHNQMQNYDIASVNDRVTSTKALYPMSDRVVKHEEPNKLTAYEKPEEFHNISKHEKLAKPTAFNKPAEYFKPEVPLKSPAYCLETASSVSLKPEVLMEDCSSKRMKALKARLDFEKFVYTGKLPS